MFFDQTSSKTTRSISRLHGSILQDSVRALGPTLFPDTLPIYAFSTLEENYLVIVVAMFIGRVGRLMIVASVLFPFFELV